ncbi:MAG: serine acetyltransferase [Chromatiales bacterium]|jgi:serine O-acetyltransferase
MKFAEMISLMKSDIQLKQLWFLKNDSWFVRNVRVYLEPGTIAVIVYRFGHWVRYLKIPVLKQLLLLIYAIAKTAVVIAFGIYIPSRLKVGRGFAIHNFSGIFLPPTTAGDNFIVFQNVTVGHLRGQGGRPPKIGNNVFLGAGAKVLGDIRIGNNVVIGANSLVINDVEDNCTVIGVPARVVSRDTNWIGEKLEGKGDHW